MLVGGVPGLLRMTPPPGRAAGGTKRQDRDQVQQTQAAQCLLSTSRRYDKKPEEVAHGVGLAPSQGAGILAEGAVKLIVMPPVAAVGKVHPRFRRQSGTGVSHCLAETTEWRDGQGRGPALSGSSHANGRGIGSDLEILHVVRNGRRSRSGKVRVSAVCGSDGV